MLGLFFRRRRRRDFFFFFHPIGAKHLFSRPSYGSVLPFFLPSRSAPSTWRADQRRRRARELRTAWLASHKKYTRRRHKGGVRSHPITPDNSGERGEIFFDSSFSVFYACPLGCGRTTPRGLQYPMKHEYFTVLYVASVHRLLTRGESADVQGAPG